MPLPEGVLLGDCEAVPLLLSEMEPVLEALAPELKDVVGLADMVLLALCVLLGVLAPVPEPV